MPQTESPGQRQRRKEQFTPDLTRRERWENFFTRHKGTGILPKGQTAFRCGKSIFLCSKQKKFPILCPLQGVHPIGGPKPPYWSLKRGIFKGEMNRNISPLNGLLVTFPPLEKSLAAAAAKPSHRAKSTIKVKQSRPGQSPGRPRSLLEISPVLLIVLLEQAGGIQPVGTLFAALVAVQTVFNFLHLVLPVLG